MPVGEITQLAIAEGVSTTPATPTPIASATGATLADGKILVGNGSNVAAEVTPSGAVSMTNAGVFSIPNNYITNAMINSTASVTSYNYLINGNFTLWQRGTSSTAQNNTTRAYTAADRWCHWCNSSGGSMAVERNTSVPTGSYYSAKISRTSGNTNTGGIFYAQSIQSLSATKLAGKAVTLTFWAKCGANYSPTSSILIATIYAGTALDEVPSSSYTGETSSSSNITLTTSWQQFSVTYSSVPTTTTEIKVIFRANNTGTAGADDSFYLSGVSITEGSAVPLNVQHDHGVDYSRAMDFYQKSYDLETAPGTASATSGASLYLPSLTFSTLSTFATQQLFKKMRTTPVVKIYSRVTGTVDRVANLSSGTDRIADSNSQGNGSFYVRHNDATSSTSGQLLAWHWTADSEI